MNVMDTLNVTWKSMNVKPVKIYTVFVAKKGNKILLSKYFNSD